MRFDGDYDEDFPGQWGLWEGARKQAFSSRRGQLNLRRLRDALIALPEPKLLSTRLADHTGAVCAMGALYVQTKIEQGIEREVAVAQIADIGVEVEAGDGEVTDWLDTGEIERQTIDIGGSLGLTTVMAVDIAWQNDFRSKETPEERYERVLAWLNTVIREEIPV